MCQCFHEVSPTCGNPRRQETPPPSSNGPPLVSGPSYLHWIIVSEFYSLFFYFPYLLVYNYQNNARHGRGQKQFKHISRMIRLLQFA